MHFVGGGCVFDSGRSIRNWQYFGFWKKQKQKQKFKYKYKYNENVRKQKNLLHFENKTIEECLKRFNDCTRDQLSSKPSLMQSRTIK